MSYNQIKVGSSSPNALGVISPNLTNDFGLQTLTDGEVLGYSINDGWKGLSISSSNKVIISSYQSQSSFTTSTANYDIGDCVIWRNQHIIIDDTTYATRADSSGTHVPAASTNWTMSWKLKASTLQGRKIVCEAVHMAKDLGISEDITYQWVISANSDLLTSVPIGNKAHQNPYYTQTAYGHYEIGESDMYLGLKVVDKNGAMGILTGSTSFNSYLNIIIIE